MSSDPALDKHFGTVAFVGCTKEEFSTYANFMAESELALEVVDGKHNSALPIYVGATVLEDGSIEVAYYSSKDGLADLVADLPEEARAFSQRLEVSMSATIHNDGTEPVALTVSGVFLNGAPVLRPQPVELERRKEVAIRMSDVANAIVSAGNWASVAVIHPRPAQ